MTENLQAFMAVKSLPHSQDDAPRAASITHLTLTEDERWAAWKARGAVHHRAARRKAVIAVPIFVLAAATLYALLAW